MAEIGFAQRVEAVRRFNRFFTKRIGVLHEGLLASRFSLAQARVLYELAHREAPTARELAAELGLDPGYLSRILRSFVEQGLIVKEPSAADGRQSLLRLSEAGHQAFAPLDARSRAEIGAMLEPLSPAEQRRLLEAMRAIERLLGAAPEHRAPFLLRPHQPGDIGWVIERHGALYAREYGWDESFEALVAEIAGHFLRRFDPKRERCWIAEKDGENVGSVFLIAETEEAAKLRLLLVEPKARGLGIGSRLVAECIRFARERQFRRITLWTNSVLLVARRIYQAQGFRLIATEPHHSFGHDLIGENWALDL
ncbi:MAG: bifunctional helix-turn-helix transcriptional regulator/GNAT family N-acetyltransferase [Stellaceae bacterium]